jgi:20S proteasome alpha/beta subunit
MPSPIHHLEPSMAASAAHGTAIAVCCRGNNGTDHVVILNSVVLSPRQSNLTAPSDARIVVGEEQEGSLVSLPLSGTRGPVRGIPFWSSSARSSHVGRGGEDGSTHVLGESVVCVATGFAPDVRHVMRVVARSESQNQHYLAKHSYHAVDHVHSMVRDTLAERLRVAALSDGGRPLGVQCLVVGCGGRTPHTTWNLHVVDPTGHWRHYGGGATAIGKHASLIRTKLHTLLYGTTTTTTTTTAVFNEMNPEGMTTTPMEVSTPKDALDVAMQSLLEATITREEWNKKEPSLPDRSFTALVLSRDRNNNHCTYSAFHPDCIRKSYTASLERAFLMTNNEETA